MFAVVVIVVVIVVVAHVGTIFVVAIGKLHNLYVRSLIDHQLRLETISITSNRGRSHSNSLELVKRLGMWFPQWLLTENELNCVRL